MKKAGWLAGEAGPPRPAKESPTGGGGAGREGFPSVSCGPRARSARPEGEGRLRIWVCFLAWRSYWTGAFPEGALSSLGWLAWLEPKEESAGAATNSWRVSLQTARKEELPAIRLAGALIRIRAQPPATANFSRRTRSSVSRRIQLTRFTKLL